MGRRRRRRKHKKEWQANNLQLACAYSPRKKEAGVYTYKGTKATGWGKCDKHPPAKRVPLPSDIAGALFGGRGIRLDESDLVSNDIDVFISLSSSAFDSVDYWYGEHLGWPMPDYGCWPFEVLRERAGKVAKMVRDGKRVMAACTGGHGRTGTLLASVMYLLNNSIVDPVTHLREVYCDESIETNGQELAVMAMTGDRKLIDAAIEEFGTREYPVIKTSYLGHTGTYGGGTYQPSSEMVFPDFEPGDIVECVNDTGVQTVKEGEIYEVDRKDPVNKLIYIVGGMGPFMTSRFKLLHSEEEAKKQMEWWDENTGYDNADLWDRHVASYAQRHKSVSIISPDGEDDILDRPAIDVYEWRLSHEHEWRYDIPPYDIACADAVDSETGETVRARYVRAFDQWFKL